MSQIRTQISLPPELKRTIEREARQQNVSMAEYLRRAAEDYTRELKITQKQRAQIAHQLRGYLKGKKGGWADMSEAEVYRWIRQERERSDERLKRLDRIIRH